MIDIFSVFFVLSRSALLHRILHLIQLTTQFSCAINYEWILIQVPLSNWYFVCIYFQRLFSLWNFEMQTICRKPYGRCAVCAVETIILKKIIKIKWNWKWKQRHQLECHRITVTLYSRFDLHVNQNVDHFRIRLRMQKPRINVIPSNKMSMDWQREKISIHWFYEKIFDKKQHVNHWNKDNRQNDKKFVNFTNHCIQ